MRDGSSAGKGGNIKRVTSGLDPRGYTVYPIAAPDKSELNRHYLWRFYKRLPKDGHIAIFDRTWYGRVMVERLEGFCSENDWQRAYNEMNEFEKELYDWGAIVIKFWVQIDNQTQLERFTERAKIHRKNNGRLQKKIGVIVKNGICMKMLLQKCCKRLIQFLHLGIFLNQLIKNMPVLRQ